MRLAPFVLTFSLLTLAGVLPVPAEDLLTAADRLARLHLPYLYGSGDPRNGGLDCSGFVQLIFRETCNIELPNEADKQLEYCTAHGHVWDANSNWTPATLKPGDVIFFAGPEALPRASMVTHVMIYAGNNLMVGAQGKGYQINGTLGGVGYYRLSTHYPTGILGESGERFIGHRHVFAYARLGNETQVTPRIAVVAMPPLD